MNRRDFIKSAGLSTALATWTVTCKYEEPEQQDPKGEKGEVGETGCNWLYRVYCYEREQGEWCFSANTRGSFDYRREYLSGEDHDPYGGWMDQGKLHFRSCEEAQDFIEDHVRAKDDTNLIDSIYDVYHLNKEGVEIHVAHYWFNGDTGRTITWKNNDHNTDYNKAEYG